MGRLFQTLGLSLGLSLVSAGALAEEWTCRHVQVQDALSGAFVEGIEDIAWDEERARFYLSAYNRRVEGAYGAIYVLNETQLDDGLFQVQSLMIDGPLRPHGITYDGQSLWVVDRQGLPHQPVVRQFQVKENMLIPVSEKGGRDVCHANDVAAIDGTLYVTNDRNSCAGFGAWFAQIFGTANGQVKGLKEDWEAIGPTIHFPNGIAPWKDGMMVSATRDDRIYHMALDGTLIGSSYLGVAPDNLNIGDDGALYFTGFDSLIGYALFRSDASNREDAPTQIFRLNHEDEIEQLDLPPQDLPAGATVVMRVRDYLVIGSAFDHGLGLCREEGAE